MNTTTWTCHEVAPEIDDRIVLSRDEEGKIIGIDSSTWVDVAVWGTHEIKRVNLRAFAWDRASWRKAVR